MNKRVVATVVLLFAIVIVSIMIGWLLGRKFNNKQSDTKEDYIYETIKYSDLDISTTTYVNLKNSLGTIEIEKNKIKHTTASNKIEYSGTFTNNVENIKLICDCEKCYELYILTENKELYKTTSLANIKKLERINVENINNIWVSSLDKNTCTKQELYLELKDNKVSKYINYKLENVEVIN